MKSNKLRRLCALPAAREDLHRLYAFQLERAQYQEELETAKCALRAIETAIYIYLQTPMIYRKAGDGKNSL